VCLWRLEERIERRVVMILRVVAGFAVAVMIFASTMSADCPELVGHGAVRSCETS
jgi:hypothetical protein